MSFFDASMEPMLDMFIFETTTLLEQLDEIMLEAEKSKSLTPEGTNEIFRIMHTIKGSSAMMGITNISALAHHVEDLFYIIREQPHKMNEHSDVIFDLIFHASDFFKSEIDTIQNPDYSPASATDLIEQLAALIVVINEGSAAASKKAAAATQASSATSSPFTKDPSSPEQHQIRVFFEDGCQMENIRSFMLLSQLKDWCDTIESDPPNPENDSQLSSVIAKDGLLVRFTTSSPLENILDIIESSVNIKSYEIVEDLPDAPPLVHTVSIEKNVDSVLESVPAEAIATQVQNVKGANAGKQSLISVNQIKLDQLMDIVGEIVIAESMVTSNPELKGLTLDNFYKATRQLRKLTDELQDIVMSIRMVPLSGVLQKMHRIVRDMSKKLNKDVELETIGGETEVDKTINDVIADPFMHMIRNALDHAIELPEDRIAVGKSPVGHVCIAAQNVGGEIIITISDDGRGLKAEQILKKAKTNNLLTKPESEYSDKEIFSMIMLPGFSTKEKVTEFSGRGVGMDVVKKNLEKVGGSISVESKLNVGTTFTIKIPLTLAIVDGMEFSVGSTIFTIPITSIKQSFKISDETKLLQDPEGAEMIMLRGECYPVLRLHKIYSLETQITDLETGILILVENEQKIACLFADELIGEQQVVVKPFPIFLNRYEIKDKGLAGCTILGDGNISLILDTTSLLNSF